MEIQEELNIIKDSISTYYFNYHTDMFSREELKYLSKSFEHDRINDRLIVHNSDVRSIVNWDMIDRMKMIRIIIGLHDIGEDIPENADVSKYKYKVKEVRHLLERRPEYCDSFKFDLNKLKISEAHMLLSMGREFFFNRIPIEKYRFNYNETIDIIRAYNYEERIMDRARVELLKGHNIAEVLIEKGEPYMKYFDLNKLNPIDWIDLIRERVEFFKHCNMSVFMRQDIYYLIQLATLYSEDVVSEFDIPNLLDLIFEIGTNKISPLGWEKLLIYNPDRFIDVCDFRSLNELNWAKIKIFRPELIVFKL